MSTSAAAGCQDGRVEALEQALLDIALLADGHRSSRAYDGEGRNIALCVVLALAATALGRSDDLRQNGTLLAAASVDRSCGET